MSPTFFNGAKTADRVPSTTWTSPRRMRFHWSYRSVIRNALWSRATWSPKQAANRRIIWGVSTISGTSTMARRPWFSIS